MGSGMNEFEAQLEAFEPDRFVSLFFVPAAVRRDVAAVYGFELELARVATQVAEPMVAQIRYAWWREQLAAAFDGRPVQAPAFHAIAPVISRHKLPRALFEGMIDAHAVDCEPFPFGDMATMERYARETAGNTIKLATRILGGVAQVDDVAEHAGAAYGLSRQLQECAHWYRHRRLRLPLSDVLGRTDDELFSGRFEHARFAVAAEKVKARIRGHLAALNKANFPSRIVSILAPAALARLASHKGFDVFQPGPVSALQRVARLAGANLLLRF
jgi:phytoene synthase